MSVAAYQNARNRVERPRATEHRLMTDITRTMLKARDAGMAGMALMPVLHYNREVWNVWRADCGTAGNTLPADLRAGIISLALWVDRHTSAVVAGRESITDLIDINLAIIDGLSGVGPEPISRKN
jgi:flagellar biosynthesis activator protein FlaF